MSRAAGLCPVTMRAFAQAVIRARRPVTGGGLMGGRVGRKSPYCGQGQAAGLCPVTMRDFAQVIIRAFRPVTGRHKPAAQGCAVRLNMLEQAYGYHESNSPSANGSSAASARTKLTSSQGRARSNMSAAHSS